MMGGVSGYHNTDGIRNTFLGIHSGNLNITGDENVFIGAAARHNNLTGSSNVAIGPGAGHNGNGNNNVFLGREAGYNELGSNKLYIENTGSDSSWALIYGEFDNDILHFNANVTIRGNLNLTGIGDQNLFLGDSSGYSNNSGVSNVFLGYRSGYSNANGNYNVLIGSNSGKNLIGEKNTFIGTSSGRLNTDGNENTFLGTSTGYNNSSGSGNVFLGRLAGAENNVGDSSVFVGYKAGYFETNSYRLYIENSDADSDNALIYGEFDNDILRFNADVFIAGKLNLSGSDNLNLFLGDSAGYFNSSGGQNTFVGHEAGNYNTTGNYNTFLGVSAGNQNTGDANVIIGVDAGLNNTTGSSNTFVGLGAGHNSSGNSNIFLGREAGYHELGSNKLYIENCGNDSTGALIFGQFDNNWVRINDSLGIGRNPAANQLEVEGTASKTSAGDWLANSDSRIKTDIHNIENATATLLQLRPVAFRYNESWKEKHPGIEDKTYYNFIAQEYQQVFPEAVQGSGEYLEGEPDEMLQIDTYPAQVVTIKAVQELILENKEQQRMINDQYNMIETQQSKIDQLEELVNRLLMVVEPEP